MSSSKGAIPIEIALRLQLLRRPTNNTTARIRMTHLALTTRTPLLVRHKISPITVVGSSNHSSSSGAAVKVSPPPNSKALEVKGGGGVGTSSNNALALHNIFPIAVVGSPDHSGSSAAAVNMCATVKVSPPPSLSMDAKAVEATARVSPPPPLSMDAKAVEATVRGGGGTSNHNELSKLTAQLQGLDISQRKISSEIVQCNMDGESGWRFDCPNCGALIEVREADTNCKIFRHGKDLNPHASFEDCAAFLKRPGSIGCAIPLRLDTVLRLVFIVDYTT